MSNLRENDQTMNKNMNEEEEIREIIKKLSEALSNISVEDIVESIRKDRDRFVR